MFSIRHFVFLSVRTRAAILAAVMASLALQAALLASWFLAPGAPMDEGALLSYGTLVLRGYVPMRDLRSFYGPLSSYLLGGTFEIFGSSLAVERALGLVYRLVLASALLLLLRRRGAWAVLAGGVVIVLITSQDGVAAYPAYGAQAAACLAIAMADLRRPAVAGAAMGVALLMRFDWFLAAIAGVPYLVAWPRRFRVRGLIAAGVVSVLYVPYLAVVGIPNVELLIEQARVGPTARAQAIPEIPMTTAYELDIMLISVLVLFALGFRRRHSDEGLSFLAVALLGVALLPHALLKADHLHVAVAAVAPLTMLATAIPVALGELSPVLTRASPRVRMALAVAGVGLVASVLRALYAGAHLEAPRGYAVRHDGRSFMLATPERARTAQLAVSRADALAPAGGGVFVGPEDLRRTTFADSYMYWLLPNLRAATFYIALDPGVTAFSKRRLADELPRAAVLILNTTYGGSLSPGPDAPNRVVARDFCVRGAYGAYRVYARCGAAARRRPAVDAGR